MVCTSCKGKRHDLCKRRNRGKEYADCDCQHRTNQKTVVIPGVTVTIGKTA